LIVSGLVDGVSAGAASGVSTGTACAAGIISGSARMSGSANLSDFADSFGTDASSILLRSGAGSTAKEVGGAATLIAITGPRPIKQKRTSHIVLDILEPKAPADWRRMGADLQD
jgi:hypothetical protein